jgi:hypothetical protein
VRAGPPGTAVLLALVIAGVALAETAVSLVTRRLSSTIGEGLILDLRTAVFDRVQRMPIASFTRTRTGALASRLGDVMGARRGFSDTPPGVVSNAVTLALTLAGSGVRDAGSARHRTHARLSPGAGATPSCTSRNSATKPLPDPLAPDSIAGRGSARFTALSSVSRWWRVTTLAV